MPILKVTTVTTGLVDVGPTFIYINTNDTLNQVSTAGYLNSVVESGTSLSNLQMALVSTSDYGTELFNIVIENGMYSLSANSASTEQRVTAATVQLTSNQTYISRKSGGTQTFLLPVSPSFGDVIRIYGARTCKWSIETGSPKYIVQGENFYNSQCTSGTSNGNCIQMVCIDAANNGWNVIATPPIAFGTT
jgi:hypothetical protein